MNESLAGSETVFEIAAQGRTLVVGLQDIGSKLTCYGEVVGTLIKLPTPSVGTELKRFLQERLKDMTQSHTHTTLPRAVVPYVVVEEAVTRIFTSVLTGTTYKTHRLKEILTTMFLKIFHYLLALPHRIVLPT